MSGYKSVVKEILELDWSNLDSEDLQKMMILSAYSALEFGESLRHTIRMHPRNHALAEMAEEELKTDNLSFGDYKQKGDHAEFLWHFIRKYKLLEKYPNLKKAGEDYIAKVKLLPSEVKVMTIVSRERELPGIFTRILTAKNWTADGLAEYKHYLERHIALDSSEGGHADLLNDMHVDDRVSEFYKIRLEMYRSVSRLFNKK